MWTIIITIVIALIIYLLVRVVVMRSFGKLSTVAGDEFARERQRFASISALTSEEAKKRVEPYLANATIFRVAPATTAMDLSTCELGPELRAFFQQYAEVKGPGNFSVSREAVAPSTIDARFIRIGADYARSEVVTYPTDDRVTIIDGSEADDDAIAANNLPSIYHLLLYVAEQEIEEIEQG